MISFSDLFKEPQFSPHISQSIRKSLLAAQSALIQERPDLAVDHLWLMSSGTESQRGSRTKLVALSREALLSAARGVMDIFPLSSSDVYLNPLPFYHIAGAAVLARQEIARFRQISSDEKWNAQKFSSRVEEEKVTCTSLVPTQIYDLVNENIVAPPSLRLVFVGAGYLSNEIFHRAKELRWPLVLTYGMTETCAMLAYKKEIDELLTRFPHISKWTTRTVDDQSRLAFSSRSLLTGFLLVDGEQWEFSDPKQDGWYLSEDVGEIVNDRLLLRGRSSELVKILGETVAIQEIQTQWIEFIQNQKPKASHDYVILAVPETRKGYELVMVTNDADVGPWLSQFNPKLPPFSRLQRWYHLNQIPRSPLGKVLRAELLSSLTQAPAQLIL